MTNSIDVHQLISREMDRNILRSEAERRFTPAARAAQLYLYHCPRCPRCGHTECAVNGIGEQWCRGCFNLISEPRAGKSSIMRASRAAGETRPLDAPENNARGAENEYSHSEGAHQR